MAPNKMYDQIPRERFEILRSRYEEFIKDLNNPKAEVTKVFDRLSPKHHEELELIREVSKELQEKKEEDMRKAAQAAEEAKAAREAEAKAELEKKKEASKEATENESETATEAVEVEKAK